MYWENGYVHVCMCIPEQYGSAADVLVYHACLHLFKLFTYVINLIIYGLIYEPLT